MKKLSLHWQIFIGLALGIIFGLSSRLFGFEALVVDQISILGDLFLRGLRMVIVPLIMASIISGVTSIDSGKNFQRLSLKTMTYYLTTTLLAGLLGLTFVNFFQPGTGAELGFSAVPEGISKGTGNLSDILLRIIPLNPIQSMAKGEMLPIIFFSLLFGYFITRSPEPYREHMTNFFQGIFEVMMRLTQFIIRFTPVGVFALLAKIVAETGFSVFIPLMKYVATVMLALTAHGIITLPILLFFIGGIRPIAHARAMLPALLTAFSTASSAATLPVSMQCVEENSGVSNKISSFVLPLGATINMDGTALYECIAAIFIAQVYGIELTIIQQLFIVLTALLASIGAAGIPLAGLVMMTVILNAVGLPLEGIGLVLAVDQILDMLRTSVNIWSDSCGAVIIASSEGEQKLKILRNQKEQEPVSRV